MSDPCEYPELVLGLVAPVGVDLSNVQTLLKDYLKQFHYKSNHIRLSSLIKKIKGLQTRIDGSKEYKRINSLMTAGDEARKKAGRGDFVAALGICSVYKEHANDKPPEKVAHIFDSIKHPDEVQTLRNVYGDGFYLIGIASSRSRRLKYLTGQKGIQERYAKKLIARDESETFEFGQHMRDSFHLSDGFVDIDAKDYVDQLARILDLLFGKPCLTPTKDEYAMFIAYAASLRSGDLSRQVGAVVTSSCDELISTGANDVPCKGGGLYWADHRNEDKRDYVLGYDANENRRNEIAIKIMKKFGDKGESEEELLTKGKNIFKDTGLFDITEYGRAVHAEMEAIISCARSGVSPRGGTLYCTTFPCHNCAKHIVAAGISRVIFVEPYPKSLASELHSDSIFLANEDDISQANGKVKFEPFVGVGPRRFLDLFSMMLSSGRTIKRKENGNKAEWERKKASLRLPMSPSSYIERETLLAAEIDELLGGKNENS
jgi:deoxycytidylate deaminase